MSKTNFYALAKNKNTSYETLSQLIIQAIEDEQFFNKEVLVPKVKSILKGFKLNVNTTKYNKIETPSDAAKRVRMIERLEIEKRFWKSKAKLFIGDNMDEYYAERDNILKESGFE